VADPQPIDRLTPARRPAGRPMGYQRWRDLLFIHWTVPVEAVQRLVAPQLTVESFDGVAWVGLVPFDIYGSRPRWLPAVPGISDFPETNVRTYVHHKGSSPGVWFFSLDAASSLGVRLARRFLSLPYYRADLSVARNGRGRNYRGRRQWPGPLGAEYAILAEFGEPAQAPHTTSEGHAIPGSLEHFLIERYLLYTVSPENRLLRGQVHHAPYPLRTARVTELQQSMLSVNGLLTPGEPQHVVFSDGVDVEIFPLVDVGPADHEPLSTA
jgi:uncharacterized protein